MAEILSPKAQKAISKALEEMQRQPEPEKLARQRRVREAADRAWPDPIYLDENGEPITEGGG